MSNDLPNSSDREKYEQQQREFFNSCSIERNRFVASKSEEAKSYDQTILTFSAGAIGVSLTFVEKIAPVPVAPTMLYVSWSFFALAILSVVVSFVLSQAAMDREIAWIDAAWAAVTAENTTLPDRVANRLTTLTRVVNWASGLLFVAGVVMLVIFGAANWPSRSTGSKIEKPTQVQIIGGNMTIEQRNSNTNTPPRDVRGNPPVPAFIQPPPQPPATPARTPAPTLPPTNKK